MTALKISAIFALGALIPSAVIAAETQQSAGIWWTYQYLPDDKTNTNSGDEFDARSLSFGFYR